MKEFSRIFVWLHQLDVKKLFPDFPRGRTQDYIDKLCDTGEELIKNSGMTWFRPMLEWLREKGLGVQSVDLSLIHQDYHMRNVLQRDEGSLVVLDWTQAEPGDYRADLAWTMLLMSTYDLPSFREIILEGYEEAAGVKVRDIEYFEALAAFRRLLSITFSFVAGVDGFGLRPEALEMMKQSKRHLTEVYHRITDVTGILFPEFEGILENL